ncbi:hypothetical protein DL96DRAFT_1595160 [Flagelloscypha sp. PMI_526]|nr:hypothetical protein DL96DRAFT_1595160 [Flagelloscypha sp. PMI_526]
MDGRTKLESELTAINIQNILHLVPIVILFYDHLITFDNEYRWIWKKPKTFSSYAFLINRYVALLGNITVLYGEFSHPWEPTVRSCKRFQLWREVIMFFSQVACVVLLTLRVWALWERSKRVLYLMSAWGAILAGLAGFSLTGQKTQAGHGELGCHLKLMSGVTSTRLASVWEVVLAYDLTVIVLICIQTAKTRKRIGTQMRSSLLSTVLHDGILYFALISSVNLINTTSYYTIEEPYLKGYFNTFSSCISVTLISRLMLNLHRAHGAVGILSMTDTSSVMPLTRTSPIELDTVINGNQWTVAAPPTSDGPPLPPDARPQAHGP